MQEQQERNNAISSSRQRLQRGAKDKVYAKRLAAASASASGGGGGDDDTAIIPLTTTANDERRIRKSNDLLIGLQKKRGPSSSSSSSLTSPKQQSETSTKQQQQRVKRIPMPPGWPFSNHNTTKKPAAAGAALKNNDNDKRRGRKRKGTAAAAVDVTNTVTATGNDRKKQNDNNDGPSSFSFLVVRGEDEEAATPQQFKRDNDKVCPQKRNKSSNNSSNTTEQCIDATIMMMTKTTTSSSFPVPSTSNTFHNATTTATNHNANTANNNNNNNKWTCVRCTLLNTSRRKKCEVCDAPRYYPNYHTTTKDDDGDGNNDNKWKTVDMDTTLSSSLTNKDDVDDDDAIVVVASNTAATFGATDDGDGENDSNEEEEVVAMTTTTATTIETMMKKKKNRRKSGDKTTTTKTKHTNDCHFTNNTIGKKLTTATTTIPKKSDLDDNDDVNDDDNDDTNDASLILESTLLSVPSSLLVAPNDDTTTTTNNNNNKNDNGYDDNLECTTVNVHITVSNMRVYHNDDDDATTTAVAAAAVDATTTTTGEGGESKMTTTTTATAYNKKKNVLSAIVPITTSILCRREEKPQPFPPNKDGIDCNVNLLENEEGVNDEVVDDVGASVTMKQPQEEEEEGGGEGGFELLQHPESQSQTMSVQSELSAMIDASPTTTTTTSSSSSYNPTKKPPVDTQDDETTTLPIVELVAPRQHKESPAEEEQEEEKKKMMMIQQQSLSQLSVQSELSAMIDATPPQKKIRIQQQQQQLLLQLPSPLQQHHQPQQQVDNDPSTDDPNQTTYSNDEDQVPQQEDGQQQQAAAAAQSPSKFKQWLHKRKNLRREKKKRSRNKQQRCKSNTTVDGLLDGGQHCVDSDGGDDSDGSGSNDSGTGLDMEFTTVVVRLLVTNTECDHTKHPNVLLAIVPNSIFFPNDDELIGMSNGVAAVGEEVYDAGDCNHSCHNGEDTMQQQQSALFRERKTNDSAAQLAQDDRSDFVEQSKCDVKAGIELDGSNSTAVLRSGRPNSTTDDSDDDTHHHSGVLPDSNEESTPLLCNKNDELCPSSQGSASVHSHFPMTQQLPDFDYFTQSIESPKMQRNAKTNRYCQDEIQDKIMSRYNNTEHDVTSSKVKRSSDELATVEKHTPPRVNTLDKENVSILSQVDYGESDYIIRQPLQHIKTVQNDIDNSQEPNVYNSAKPDKLSTSGTGFSSAGSGKTIAVDEDEMAKAAKMLTGDAAEKAHTTAYDYDDEAESVFYPPSSGTGFFSAGSGKTIAVDEEEMAKAAKMLADDAAEKAHTTAYDYDDEAESVFYPPSSGTGFFSAGSGKTIAVDEDEMAKAAKMLADDAAEKAHTTAYDYDDEAESVFYPPSSGTGFFSAGSGKTIAVDEEEMAKAAKMLADDAAEKAHTTAYDYDDEAESVFYPPSSGTGFFSAGSGKTIAVDEEEMAKAAKMLADDAAEKAHTTAYDYDDEAESVFYPPSSGTGFFSAGSGKTIAVDEEEMAKAAKMLADDAAEKAHTTAYDYDDEAESVFYPPSSGTGFFSAGSGKTIAVDEEEMAKAAKMLADDAAEKAHTTAYDYDDEAESVFYPPSSGTGFFSAGSGKTIAVDEDEMAKAAKMLADDAAEKAHTTAYDYDDEAESVFYPPSSGTGFFSAGSGKTIAVDEEEMAKAAKMLADDAAEKAHTTAYDYDDEAESVFYPPSSGTGFFSAGSGKTIAVDEEEMAKAAKMLADDAAEKAHTTAYDYDDEAESVFYPPSSGTGFFSAGSGKTIAVDEDEMAKAAKMLADDAAEKAHTTAYDYDDEAESVFYPPSSGTGFFSAGSGKTIAVDEEEMAKAAKMLADDAAEKAHTTAYDYDDEAESVFYPPSSGTGFFSAGSGKTIAVDEEEMAKAAKMLADDAAEKAHTTAYDYDDEAESVFYPPSSGTGFFSAGSGKTIAVDEEEMAKAAKMLADDAAEKALTIAYDYDDEAESVSYPSSSGTGFFSAGSGKTIAVDEEEMAKAAKMLADDTEEANEIVDHEDNLSHDRNVFGSDDFEGRKSSQKVRFSLEGKFFCVDTSLEKNVSSVKLPCPSSDSLIQSIVTPAKNHAFHRELQAGGFGYSSSLPCKIDDHANIVTDNKDQDPAFKCFLGGVKHVSNSPCDSISNSYTPLNATHRRDSLQSEIKSKRLFVSASSSKKSDDTIASLDSDVSSSTKITLRQLAERCNMETEWDSCKNAGVSDIVLKITSVNAMKLRFSQNEGLPSFFFGQQAVPSCSHIGSVEDIYKWLVEEGFDESLFTKKWIQNHYRWIVWKLGSMERRFPSQLSGRYLTYQHVLLQLKSRYEKELCSAQRPSVRKILNRDVSAGLPIVLCVAQILRFRSKGNSQEPGKKTDTEEIRLELTDGWYGVSAVIDTILQTFVVNDKIRVGSKLFICNAQISGSDDGVDPLDERYFSDKRNCPLFLKITVNNTRLAKWDAKLGFGSPTRGGITVKSFCDIYPGGGNIPSIDIVICKRYPKMFLEQMTTGVNQSQTTTHLTEDEEASRQSEYDLKTQRASEKHADAAHTECAKEVDDDAPSEWKQMVVSNAPDEYYENLSSAEKKVVDDWNERRPVLLQSMISKYIGDSMREESAPERKSNPYVKMLVVTFHRNRMIASTQTSAELTVWRVSDEQFELLKEGTVVRMKNLGVKEKSRDGILQLRAGPETVMVPLSDESKRQLAQSGYEERRPKSLIKIYLMSKKMETDRLSNEVDVVACVAKIQQLDENSTAMYLTDESGLALKLVRNHSATNTDPFQLGISKACLVVSFCNIQLTAFDEIEQCATGTWGLFSCKSNCIGSRCEELDLWSRSQCGVDTISAIRARIEADIPVIGGMSNKHQISIGYILAFLEEDGCTNSQRIKVAIDYGEIMPLIADFPIHLIQHTLGLLQNIKFCEHAQPADVWDVSWLNEYFQNNQKLFHFLFEFVSCYGGNSPTLRITQVSLANVDALSRLLMAT